MNEQGGTRAVLKGNLKRRLVSCTIANVAFGEPGAGLVTVSPVLRGLSSVLKCFAGVGALLIDDDGETSALRATQWPVGAGTLQMTPQSNFDDRPKQLFREVFQDPTFNDNDNHPLPMALPFSWNFPGEADEAVFDIVLDKAAWVGFGRGGIQINLQVMVEYFGPWWDVTAIELALGQVQLSPPKALQLFAS